MNNPPDFPSRRPDRWLDPAKRNTSGTSLPQPGYPPARHNRALGIPRCPTLDASASPASMNPAECTALAQAHGDDLEYKKALRPGSEKHDQGSVHWKRLRVHPHRPHSGRRAERRHGHLTMCFGPQESMWLVERHIEPGDFERAARNHESDIEHSMREIESPYEHELQEPSVLHLPDAIPDDSNPPGR